MNPIDSSDSSAGVFHHQALQGRVAVVTGAAGGLGSAIATRLASMGATLVVVDLRTPELPATHGDHLALTCDIADAESVAAMGVEVDRRFGRCDVLVNNAGTKTAPVPLEQLATDEWDRVFDVNVRGAFLCAKAVAGMMLLRAAGSIVNIASIGAQMPTHVGAYGSSKAALCGLTRQMAVQWGPCGIRANSVSPGMVRTPMSDAFYRDEQHHAARVAMMPVRRIGVPGDIADAVAFLASDAASFVSGHDLVVDGGFMAAPLFNAEPHHRAASGNSRQ
jgi:NAD(P)-dependent dehydrogenase (short-subunit alcohol dehydrogenase family)